MTEATKKEEEEKGMESIRNRQRDDEAPRNRRLSVGRRKCHAGRKTDEINDSA